MTRDLTRKQFAEKLARRGFRRAPYGPWFESTTGGGPQYGAVVDGITGRILRRATLRRIIAMRRRLDPRERAYSLAPGKG